MYKPLRVIQEVHGRIYTQASASRARRFAEKLQSRGMGEWEATSGP